MVHVEALHGRTTGQKGATGQQGQPAALLHVLRVHFYALFSREYPVPFVTRVTNESKSAPPGLHARTRP
eukprot:COSAG02_NODE_138_length_34440_cov_16.694368_1_plen_68_part_10